MACQWCLNEEDTVVVADGARSGLAIRGVAGALGSTLLRYTAKDGFDKDFIHYLLESLYPFTNAATIGGAIPHLDKRLLARLELRVPSKEERETIGSILRTADKALEAAKLELEAALYLKTGFMQHLFLTGIPGHHSSFERLQVLRKHFDIPAQWEAARLGGCSASIQYGTSAPSNGFTGGYPVIAIPQVVAHRLELGDVPYVLLSDREAESLRLQKDDVLLVRTNGNPDYIAKSTAVTEEVASQHVVFASYLIRVRTNPNLLLGTYLNYFLASPLGRRQALAMANTSAGNHNLGARSLKQFWLPRPSIVEQERIVEIMDSSEDTIDALTAKLDSLTRLKKSLLQNLITGKVRVRMGVTA